ncbi:MAG: hypothetical protein [Wendovervirus sonii]|uniref:Uncharacterized protein n=1 Tax=phage Lak_Megaphage_Sonny TaxID=3109229 RepID=A0ABZ0Z6C3_9CAUD|nr:MAG: hypothetical protein [phage Lak_Megaphage_Sonny]
MTSYHLTCSSYRFNCDRTTDSWEEICKTQSMDTVLEWLTDIAQNRSYDTYQIHMYEITDRTIKSVLQYTVDCCTMKVEVEKNKFNINLNDFLPKDRYFYIK